LKGVAFKTYKLNLRLTFTSTLKAWFVNTSQKDFLSEENVEQTRAKSRCAAVSKKTKQ